MKILGFDTTTKFFCLGVYDNGSIYEYNLELNKKHSTLLMVTVSRVLEALDWDVGEIDYFASGVGPGSFTGVRIGCAAVKGFAFSLRKPVLGISTLDILAKNVLEDAVVVPALDAKRELIYCSVYRNKPGSSRRIAPYMLLSKEEFFKKIKPNSIIFGDAVNLYKEGILKNIKGATILDKDYWYPRGHNIISLALEKIKNKNISNAFNLKPIYLYPKECQIKVVNK